MAALVVLMLADRGEIDLDGPVSRYWPEFAANGKSGILVRHILGHTAGLPGWDEPMTVADLLDHEKASTLLARQAPWWEPGKAVGYHPISFGPLLSEIVRRVTGETLGQFFAHEVATPLGAEFHIGTGPECDARVSLMVESSPPRKPLGDGSISDRAFFNPYVLPQDSHSIAWRRAELAGSNGHGNAHAVARVQSLIANGGEVDGKRLLSRAGSERALELQFEGKDLVAGYPLRWGLGFALANPDLNRIYGNRFAGHRIAFWGGSGGSVVVNDLDLRMTIAFVMNKHVEHGGIDRRGVDYIVAAYDAAANL
jgi:CubicO group peptidase (beta-lactamase class C family)